MKTIILLLTLALAGLTTGNLSAQTNAAIAMEDPAHVELRVLRGDLLTAMNKGDLDGVLSHLHTNIVITWQNAEVSRGREGVRAYYNRVMTGPNKVVESFKCNVNVDELTLLYGGNTGISFGSSDEHYKLTSGLSMSLKGRWTATLIRADGHWLVASLHASTNLFDNPLLNLTRKTVYWAGGICLVAGILLGWLLGRKRKH
jgi:ketosteroid isomerase-like protein